MVTQFCPGAYIVKDTAPEEDTGTMHPDVDILRKQKKVEEPEEPFHSPSTIVPTPPYDERLFLSAH